MPCQRCCRNFLQRSRECPKFYENSMGAVEFFACRKFGQCGATTGGTTAPRQRASDDNLWNFGGKYGRLRNMLRYFAIVWNISLVPFGAVFIRLHWMPEFSFCVPGRCIWCRNSAIICLIRTTKLWSKVMGLIPIIAKLWSYSGNIIRCELVCSSIYVCPVYWLSIVL